MVRSRPSSILMQHSPDSVIPSSASVSSREFVAAPKRIRFAPLPEPDRQDAAATPQVSSDAADGSDPDPPSEDLVASSSSSSSSSSINSTPLIPGQIDDKSSPASSVGSSPVILLSSLPSKNIPDYINSPTSPSDSEPPYATKSNPLLRPFKRFYTSSSGSSSNTLTPTPSINTHTRGARKSITKEEILSLGVVNLFRTTSRESTQSVSSLNRWGSSISLAGSSISLPSGSSPLSRSQSNQSYKSKSASRFPALSSSSISLSSDSKTKSKAKPIPLGQQPRSRHKGTVMLNGRVYGAKKNDNPFANICDEEPEFVEWGYGGMGSVKGAKSAGVSSNWARLHGGSAVARDNSQTASRGQATEPEPDLDDGSGVAWVRKRREERERKAREQKEKEEKEDEKEVLESQTNTPTKSFTLETISPIVSIPSISLPPCAIEIATTQRPPAIDLSALAIVPEDGEIATNSGLPTPTRLPELGISPSSSPGKPEAETSPLHNTHVVNVPVRSPRRSSSRGGRELSVSAERPAVIQVAESPILVSSSGDDTTHPSTVLLHTSTIIPIEIDKLPCTPSLSSSESESGSEVDDDDDGDDEDDDEEDEEEGISTLGNAAGLERISRHNRE